MDSVRGVQLDDDTPLDSLPPAATPTGAGETQGQGGDLPPDAPISRAAAPRAHARPTHGSHTPRAPLSPITARAANSLAARGLQKPATRAAHPVHQSRHSLRSLKQRAIPGSAGLRMGPWGPWRAPGGSTGPALRRRRRGEGNSEQSDPDGTHILSWREQDYMPVGLLAAWTDAVLGVQGGGAAPRSPGSSDGFAHTDSGMVLAGRATSLGAGSPAISLSSLPQMYSVPAAVPMRTSAAAGRDAPPQMDSETGGGRGVRVAASLVSGLSVNEGQEIDSQAAQVRVPVYQHLLPAALPVSATDVSVYQRYLALGQAGHAAAVDALPLLSCGGASKAAYFSSTVHVGAGCVSAGDISGNSGLVAQCFHACASETVPASFAEALGEV